MVKATVNASNSSNIISPWPVYGEDEIQAVSEILRSGRVNYWTGNITREFEQVYARYHNIQYGIAVANGTLALELALLGLNIAPGDEIVTTPRTFIASSSCIVRLGGIPVFADIDPNSQNITAESIAKVITKKTKAIIVVHLGGWPCDMNSIMNLAKLKNLFVIEDCAQAHGAKIHGKLVGSFGDISAFSFCQDKIISTAGEGGFVLTNDPQLYKKMWEFKDHGKKIEVLTEKPKTAGFRWLHDSFGTNFRMTEIQAVTGLLQLGKLEGWVRRRREIALAISESLADLKYLKFPAPDEGFFHSYYRLYGYLKIEKMKSGWSRDSFMQAVAAEGIPCFTGSCGEIYLEKAFEKSSFAVKERLPEARAAWEASLAFLTHPTLTQDYIDNATFAIRKVYREAFGE